MNYGTVGILEGTVANHKETVGFKMATDWLKSEKSIEYGTVAKRIGLTRSRLQMLRMFRTKVKKQEVDNLLQHYPDAAQFFKKLDTNTLNSDRNPPVTEQTLHEPMGTHFYGKSPDPWQQLAETRKLLLDKQADELAALREQVRLLEMEKKVLTSTIEGILSNNK